MLKLTAFLPGLFLVLSMRNFRESALLTDLYQLTMLQAYFLRGMNGTAVFEFFVRRLPDERHFLLAAGLEQVIAYLEDLHFDDEEIAWLRESGMFDAGFVDSLQGFGFSGDAYALPEGTVCFSDEPIMRIVAPLREAQLIESRLINLLHFQTVVASKAARCVIAAQGKRLIDFGLRRAHGAEAAILSARASYLAGFDGTATALASPLMGIPVFGTMAHSFVQAHESESEAFAAFAYAFPGNTTLLIDTYDTESAARKVVSLANRLRQEEGINIKAVRIDSGDLAEMARRVRLILDGGGCGEIGIFATGSLDEYAVEKLVRDGAPIDGFGIGTRMNTSADTPFLDCAYKLQEYAGEPRRKRSPGKETWPGRKQVFRRFGDGGLMQGDMLAVEDEEMPGLALLQPVLRNGKKVSAQPSLPAIRDYARSQLAALPSALKTLGEAAPYPVMVSKALRSMAQEADERQRRRALTESTGRR